MQEGVQHLLEEFRASPNDLNLNKLIGGAEARNEMHLVFSSIADDSNLRKLSSYQRGIIYYSNRRSIEAEYYLRASFLEKPEENVLVPLFQTICERHDFKGAQEMLVYINAIKHEEVRLYCALMYYLVCNQHRLIDETSTALLKYLEKNSPIKKIVIEASVQTNNVRNLVEVLTKSETIDTTTGRLQMLAKKMLVVKISNLILMRKA
jgi:hypothetical protein